MDNPGWYSRRILSLRKNFCASLEVSMRFQSRQERVLEAGGEYA